MRILKKTLWPKLVAIDNADKMESIEIWLDKNLGVFRGKWNAVYHYNKTDFYFRDEKDALMFMLRWV